jgi:predicted N-formylglutamate amidohydrolase
MVTSSPDETLLFAIHTFTREFNPGEGRPVQLRPVELGVLCRPSEDLQPGMPARLLMDSLLAQGVDARVNDPYGDADEGPGGAVGAYGGK